VTRVRINVLYNMKFIKYVPTAAAIIRILYSVRRRYIRRSVDNCNRYNISRYICHIYILYKSVLSTYMLSVGRDDYLISSTRSIYVLVSSKCIIYYIGRLGTYIHCYRWLVVTYVLWNFYGLVLYGLYIFLIS